MIKKSLSVILAVILAFSTFSSMITANAATVKEIKNVLQLRNAFKSEDDMTYLLMANIGLTNNDSEISSDFVFDGNRDNNYCITSTESDNGATFYQLKSVNSRFDNTIIKGNSKGDVGIWVGAGSMSFNNSSITGYKIKNGQMSAVAVAGSAVLNVADSELTSNTGYDVCLIDKAVMNVNSGAVISNVRVRSQYVEINIGSDWNGSLNLTFDSPVSKPIGKVGSNCDISGISVTNEGFCIVQENGLLCLKRTSECAIHFDMSKRDKLFKGSAGFLYGTSETNVPSVDLLQGLKPATMVQKTIAGKQHPTGDVARNRSSVLNAGAKDLQVYFQDYYLEWPYDAPYLNSDSEENDDSPKIIDVDSYQKVVEGMMYQLVCTKTDEITENSFEGSDGNSYLLNNEVAEQYSYVLFNEPDSIWFNGMLSELEQAWKQIYDAVHAIDPNAKCVGPNYSGFSETDYNTFFSFCKANNCLPEIISWHELGDISLTDFYSHYDSVQGYIEKYYDEAGFTPRIIVNEYARHYDIGSPGGLVKWLSMFEDKDISGCMAYWAMANSLNELAADQNSPSSSWWIYHWYAQMTGNQCPLTYPSFENTRFYGTVSYDEEINMGYALFGGNEDWSGNEYVYLDNMSSTNLINDNGAVNVKLYAVSFSGQQGANYKPDCIFDAPVSVNGDSLKITVTDTDEMDAFFAVLTLPENTAESVEMSNVTIPALSYEAENAELIGNATSYPKNEWFSFATSGRRDVGNILDNGDGIEFKVDIPTAGLYTASIFYSLQSPFVNPYTLEPDEIGQNRGIGKTLPFGVYLDGVRLPDIYLESTISWLYKNHCDIDMELSEGEHSIRFEHINGDERYKGNLQLTAAFDKLDLNLVTNQDNRNDFEISLSEMTSFKEGNSYRITAVAPAEGYYKISTDDAEFTASKQCINYASDAKTFSEMSVYDVPIGDIVYLSKGANTLAVKTDADTISFEYDRDKTDLCSKVVTADKITLHGNKPVYKDNSYAVSGKVISELGIGQTMVINNDSPEKNYVYFKVNADNDGVYNLSIRYANNEPAPVMLKDNGDVYIHPYNIDLVERYAQIVVNSAEPQTVYFRNTMSWDSFKSVDVQVNLTKGQNIIKIYNDNSYQFSSLVNSTAPEIDTITVSSLSYSGNQVELVDKSDFDSHNYNNIVISPTYDEVGYTIYTCLDCGYSYLGDYTDKLVPIPTTTQPDPTEDDTTVQPSYEQLPSTTQPVPSLTTTFPITTANQQSSTVDAEGQAYSTTNAPQVTTPNSSDASASQIVTDIVTSDGNKEPVEQLLTTQQTYESVTNSPTQQNTDKTSISSDKIKKPKSTKIKKLQKGKKLFKVSWNKVSGVNGYQIQYSTDKKFKKNKKSVVVSKQSATSKKISKLASKKKYYVRIRTYKLVKVNGKRTKQYSAWSAVKTVKTK